MAELKVGGEVDSYCTRCKLTLAHTVLAIWASQIKRVRCNTCMGEHAYRSAGGSSSTSSAGRTSAAAPRAARASTPAPSRAEKAAAASYSELIAGKNRARARRYSLNDKYEVGEVIEHPTFGVGVVAAKRGLDKIDVAFPATARTLLHDRGTPHAPLAKPVAPRVPDVRLEDEGHEPDPTEDTSDEPELGQVKRA